MVRPDWREQLEATVTRNREVTLDSRVGFFTLKPYTHPWERMVCQNFSWLTDQPLPISFSLATFYSRPESCSSFSRPPWQPG